MGDTYFLGKEYGLMTLPCWSCAYFHVKYIDNRHALPYFCANPEKSQGKLKVIAIRYPDNTRFPGFSGDREVIWEMDLLEKGCSYKKRA